VEATTRARKKEELRRGGLLKKKRDVASRDVLGSSPPSVPWGRVSAGSDAVPNGKKEVQK